MVVMRFFFFRWTEFIFALMSLE
jgi:DDE superfamily endonuclease